MGNHLKKSNQCLGFSQISNLVEIPLVQKNPIRDEFQVPKLQEPQGGPQKSAVRGEAGEPDSCGSSGGFDGPVLMVVIIFVRHWCTWMC